MFQPVNEYPEYGLGSLNVMVSKIKLKKKNKSIGSYRSTIHGIYFNWFKLMK